MQMHRSFRPVVPRQCHSRVVPVAVLWFPVVRPATLRMRHPPPAIPCLVRSLEVHRLAAAANSNKSLPTPGRNWNRHPRLKVLSLAIVHRVRMGGDLLLQMPVKERRVINHLCLIVILGHLHALTLRHKARVFEARTMSARLRCNRPNLNR